MNQKLNRNFAMNNLKKIEPLINIAQEQSEFNKLMNISLSHFFRQKLHNVRYRGSDVLSSFSLICPEPPSDRARIVVELVHEVAEFSRFVVSSRTEDVDVIKTGV